MTKRYTCITLSIALLSCGWSSTTHAEQRWFTAGTLSLGGADLHNSSSRGTLGTGQLIGGYIDGQITNKWEIDTVAGIGGSIGVTGNAWSFESELLWRVRTDWDLAAPSPSIRTVTNIHTNISNTTLLLNLSRHWGPASSWQWHLGGGVGVSFNHFETDYKERAIPGEREELELTADRRSEQLAWNLSAGVSRKFSNGWRGRIRYRYIDLGEVEAGPFAHRNGQLNLQRNVRVVARHSVHELQLTLIRLWNH